MHSPEKWTTCCITSKNDLKKNMLTCDMKFNIYRKWSQMKAKNGHITYESYARTTLIDVKIAIFLSCIKCYFSVKFTSQMAYGDRWELFTYLKLCIILCSNIIFISRFKCVVHHFKLFAVEWRYSFTNPKWKKNYTFRECFYWILYHVHVWFLMKTFYFHGLNQVSLSNLVFIVLNNIDGLKVDFCTKRYY